MSIERMVELFAIIHLGTAGLSHVVAPKAWARYFMWLASKEEAGVLVVALMSLWFGSIVAAFHQVWSGIPLILTLLGWSQVTKALIYSCFPRYGLHMLRGVSLERARMFVYAGAVLLALAGILTYHLVGSASRESAAGRSLSNTTGWAILPLVPDAGPGRLTSKMPNKQEFSNGALGRVVVAHLTVRGIRVHREFHSAHGHPDP